MDAPPVQFAISQDGKSIAYSVAGQGRPLVWLPNHVHHINWSWAQWPEWLQGLTQRFRLVQFNFRGQGPSSRGLTPDLTPGHYEHDLETVLRTLKLERTLLMGTGIGAHTAVRFAIKHPERVEGLMINCTSLSMATWPGSFWEGLSRESWEVFLESIPPRGLTPDQTRLWENALREMYTADDFAIAIRAARTSDLAGDLPRLRTTALVLHPRHYSQLPAEEGARVAAAAGARYVVIDGEHMYGDAAQALRAIDDFVAGLPRVASAGGPDSESGAGLTLRELEVLRLIASGRSNQQIAEALVISLNTVARHVSNIFDKTGAANRAEATTFAHRHGLL